MLYNVYTLNEEKKRGQLALRKVRCWNADIQGFPVEFEVRKIEDD